MAFNVKQKGFLPSFRPFNLFFVTRQSAFVTLANKTLGLDIRMSKAIPTLKNPLNLNASQGLLDIIIHTKKSHFVGKFSKYFHPTKGMSETYLHLGVHLFFQQRQLYFVMTKLTKQKMFLIQKQICPTM
jgi:hypothetical protein